MAADPGPHQGNLLLLASVVAGEQVRGRFPCPGTTISPLGAPDAACLCTATALDRSHHHRSFLLRGERTLRSTSSEALAAYEAERDAARAMAGRALAEAEDFDEARALWPGMLDLGAHEPSVWRIGAEIASRDDAWLAVDSEAPFQANRIYYSNHDAYELKAHPDALCYGRMVATGEMTVRDGDVDLDALRDRVRCPMFRASRLYDAVCAVEPSAGGCTIGGWGSDVPGRVRRLMATETDCERERTAELGELLFSPVPVATFLEAVGHRNRQFL